MVDLTWILDPEIVIPSPQGAADLHFWNRMLDRAEDHRPRLGAETMRALWELADNPPDTGLLADRDFWKIIGLYTSRGFPSSSSARALCETHLKMDYKPKYGSSTNRQLLLDDLRSAGPLNQIVLSSTVDCWAPSHRACEMCETAGVHPTHAATDSDTATSTVAFAWRRGYLIEHSSDVGSIAGLASKMFPSLTFHPQAWDRLSSLVGADQENTPKLIHSLGVLNDHAGRIWSDYMTREERQRAMASLGVTCSPDSPKTHQNKKAMKERNFQFNGIAVQCEWHTKLRPDANRIHFNVEGDKVYIGTIVDHLST